MFEIIKWTFGALFVLSGITLGIEIGTLYSWWIGLFVGICAAGLGGSVVYHEEIWGVILTFFVCVVVWTYTLSIDAKCWFHDGLLSTEKNTTTYMEMLYKQVKDNDVEDATAIVDNFGEWLETLESDEERELVRVTVRQYYETHVYQKGRVTTFYKKHQDELPSLSKIL